MGDLLFIRVSAQTYDETRVPKAWPVLYRTAYADPKSNSSKPDPGSVFYQPHGVLELIATLNDQFHFGDLPPAMVSAMQLFITKLDAAVSELETALANRNAQTAHELTNTIETLLSEMEKAVQDVSPAR